MYPIKIRHGFDLYHHAVYGYYPSWDEVQEQYTAKVTNEKWSLWKKFFLSHDKAVLEGLTPKQMMGAYDLMRDSEAAGRLDQRNPHSNWEIRRPMDNPL